MLGEVGCLMLDKAHLGDVGFRDIPMYGPQKHGGPM